MTLSSEQILAVYNHHAPKPTTGFASDGIGMWRLNKLLAKIEVSLDDAVAATFPEAKQPADKPKKTRAKSNTSKPDGEEARELRRMKEQVKISNAKYEAYQAAKKHGQGGEEPEIKGKARSLIASACGQPEGATSAELHAITGWKFASWSHQLKLITKQTGLRHEIRKVDGATRYFLTTEAVAE